ncbi:TonB C-terminal domain-containing protein [Pseudoduganella sp. R-32]|uniref:TonB C-terminal domain-containing protein n=1 Tax=Pseudoduganella sp. R-32 TaxID=3404061 RepID=UPI003CE7E898
MRDTFPFLLRLGVDAGADAKDIRRAYARELKKIDQEADPDGFQELRQAYEVALQWQAHQEVERQAAAPAGVDDAGTPLAAAPETEPVIVAQPAPDDPYQLADQAFTQFQSSAQELASKNESRHQSRWREALQASLSHDSLLNLTARTIFEARIAHLLATGWKPGHETLFVAASEVLDWARDSRRIQQFGEAGAMVDRAINQWKLYESMSAHAMGTVKQLIQTVRNTPNPERVAARDDLILFHQLTDRFYHWFSIIIDREILQKWHQAAQAEIARNGTTGAVPRGEAPVESSGKSGWSWSGWQITFMIILLVKGCAALLTSGSHGPSYTSTTRQADPVAYQNAVNQAMHEELQAARTLQIAPEETPPTEEQLEAVRRQIFYVPERGKGSGVLKVSFDVELDGMGKVINVQRTQSSSDPAYDEAVARTLQHTKVFPPGTQRKFPVSYSYRLPE